VAAAVKTTSKSGWRRYLPLYALLAITIVPIAAAYIAYYVVPPAGRTNYGTLIEPQRLLAPSGLRLLDGSAFDLQALRGKWVFVMVDDGDCDARCSDKLLMMRQQRTIAGKDRQRIERVWLISDAAPLSTVLMREYEGTHFVRAKAAPLQTLLPLPEEPGARLDHPIWLIDPRGNLMLRWPKEASAAGIKRDVARLLKVDSGWVRIDAAQPQSAPRAAP